jgi:hypothetical protein
MHFETSDSEQQKLSLLVPLKGTDYHAKTINKPLVSNPTLLLTQTTADNTNARYSNPSFPSQMLTLVNMPLPPHSKARIP